MAQHIFADLNESRALLIGAGETIELVARHLYRAGVRQLTVANRTLGRALDLAALFDAKAIALGDIPDVLPEVDIIISSTASQLPILGKGAVETALKKRRHKPFFMVDIAVPRDIEPQVGQLDDVYLYTVDDLKEVIEENQRGRESAAREAEQIIEVGANEFMRQLRELDVVDTVTSLREQAHSICEEALEKAQRQLQAGKAPEQVIEMLARGLTNKLLHQPTVKLREASAEGRDDLQQLVIELFQLPGTDKSDRQD
jgi:glutamyl-tRNA reductase